MPTATTHPETQAASAAVPPLTSTGLVCPSCHHELIPTSLGHACAVEGKFFTPALVYTSLGPSSNVNVFGKAKAGLSVNLSGGAPEFLEILQGRLRARGFKFTLEGAGPGAGLEVATSGLRTSTTITASGAPDSLTVRFAHRTKGIWLHVLIALLFPIPALIVAIVVGRRMKKRMVLLDWSIFESLAELRQRARAGAKFEPPAPLAGADLKVCEAALAIEPQSPGKRRITAGGRFLRFGIWLLAAFVCAAAGGATQQSAKTLSELLAWPFFVSVLIALYQLVAGIITLFRKP